MNISLFVKGWRFHNHAMMDVAGYPRWMKRFVLSRAPHPSTFHEVTTNPNAEAWIPAVAMHEVSWTCNETGKTKRWMEYTWYSKLDPDNIKLPEGVDEPWVREEIREWHRVNRGWTGE